MGYIFCDLHTVLFTDDVLIFTESPASEMTTIKETFDEFRLCSGLRINYNKSKTLPLGSFRTLPWTFHSPFIVAKTHITYLGFKIGKVPATLNYPP